MFASCPLCHPKSGHQGPADLLGWPAGDDIMIEFKLGQYVYYRRHSAEGRFIVIRLLPRPKGETRYVIRSEEDPEREYTIEADELRRVQGGR